MELHVMSDTRLESTDAWQRAIDAEGFPLRLSPDVKFRMARGFFPALLRGKLTGFECFHDNAHKTQQFLGWSQFDHPWKFALGFRWIAREAEQLAAWMAGTAYARATGGVVFDPEQGKVLSPGEATDVVGQIERDAPLVEAAIHEIMRRLTSKT
jgi:hypothetical protein